MAKSKVRIVERKKFVNGADAPKVSHALEDYLKSIYQLAEESQPVIAARIAAETGVSPSTIFTTLQRLAREGYVTINRRKEIHLTPDGRTVAEKIVRRHFLTERFLTDLLGLDWVKAHQEAHRLEHAISQDVEERLAKLLSNPTTCPHGNPIPGARPGPSQKTIPLNEAADERIRHLQAFRDRLAAQIEKWNGKWPEGCATGGLCEIIASTELPTKVLSPIPLREIPR